MLLLFGSKSIIKYAAMRTSIFDNEYCGSTSTDSLRKQRPATQIVSLDDVLIFPMMQPMTVAVLQ
jgi:hypothetical protein